MLIKSTRILLLSLLLSGFLKAISLYIGLNLNYILVPVFFATSMLTLIIISRFKFDSTALLFLIFFIASGAIFLINNSLQDNNYTGIQIFLALFMQCILPVCFILFSCSERITNSPDLYNTVVNFILKLNILVLAIYLVAISLNYQRVINFYSELLEGGAIINPFQTSEAGISIRFSGIFNSGFLLAAFCGLAINYVYFNRVLGRFKFQVLYSILLIIVFLTYNRNGIIAFLISTIFILVNAYFYKAYTKLIVAYFSSLILALFIFPVILLYYSDYFFTTISSATDETALTKVSTLFSRIEAWIVVLKINNIKDLLIGTGLVQGLGENIDNFYVDNGYLYILNQGGLLLLIFYIISWVMMFSSLLLGLNKCSNNILLRNEIQMCLSLIAVSMTIAFLNNFFFEPLFLILVFMKCLTVNNKINLYYER